MPPDRVRKKITNYVEIFRGKMWGDTLNYAEISTVKSLSNVSNNSEMKSTSKS